MTKVNTLEIKKKIKVKETWLSSSGLEILYDYDGAERFERFTQLVAAEILRYHGIIVDYCNDDDYLEVSWLIDYEYTESDYKPVIKTASWEMFTEHYTLSQYEALDIAVKLENDRALRTAMKEAQAQNGEKYKLFS